MSDKTRNDLQTRFQKGQSGNPSGRPKGRKNNGVMLEDTLMRKVRIKDNGSIREIPKLFAAAEICLNNALKGDLKCFAKIMDLADKFGLLEHVPVGHEPVTVIRRIIVDPRQPGETEYGGLNVAKTPRT